MIPFKDNKNKSALSTRWAQMSKQEQIIEKKKQEIQAKLASQKQAAALAAQAKLAQLGSKDDGKSNIFSNDGSFMNQFKQLLEKQRRDKEEKERIEHEKVKAANEEQWREREQQESEERERESTSNQNKRESRWAEDDVSSHNQWPDNEEEQRTFDNPQIPSLMNIPVKPPCDPSPQGNDNSNQWNLPPNPPSFPGTIDQDQGHNMGPPGPPGPNLGPPGPNHGPPGPNLGPPGPNLGPPGPNHGPPGPNHGPPGPNLGPPGPNLGPPGPNLGPPGPNLGPPGPNLGPMGHMGPNMSPMPPGPAMPNQMPHGGPMHRGQMPPGMGPPGMGQQGGPHGPMPPFMGGPPNFPPMPPFMGPNGPNGPNGPMPPFFGPPFRPNGPPMMGPNGPPPPPNSMMPPNSMNNGNMPFMGQQPPFGPNGPPNFGNGNGPPNFGNGNGPPMPPFMRGNLMPPGPMRGPDSKPDGPPDVMHRQNIPNMPPGPPNMMKNECDIGNVPMPPSNQVLSADSFPPTVQRAAAEVARNGDQWEVALKAIHSQDQSMWFLHDPGSMEYKRFRQMIHEIRRDSFDGFDDKKPVVKPEDKYEPEFSLEDDDSNEYKYPAKDDNSSNADSNSQSQWSQHQQTQQYQHSQQLQHPQQPLQWNSAPKREPASSQSDEEQDVKRERRKRKKSRWGADPPVDIKPPSVIAPGMLGPGYMPPLPPGPPLPAGAHLAKIEQDGLKLNNVNRNNLALMQYATTNYGTTNLSPEDWKKCEDNFKLNLLYQDMLKKRQELERLAAAGKHKYEYDSDEDTAEGTWEHKLRSNEMNATARWADELTKQAAGKHHIGDFLPPEELKKFMEKYSAVKSGKEPDLSDYKEFKLKEDNVGFKMLQKLGWSEGQGLGAEGSGIVDPINKANQPVANLGLGAASGDGVSPDDDEFDAYRKRMMLAYRFRPNPLNNPRRPYY